MGPLAGLEPGWEHPPGSPSADTGRQGDWRAGSQEAFTENHLSSQGHVLMLTEPTNRHIAFLESFMMIFK